MDIQLDTFLKKTISTKSKSLEKKEYPPVLASSPIRFLTTPVDFIDYLYIGETVISMTTRKNGPRSLQTKLEQGILNITHPGYHQARTFYAPNYANPLPMHEKPDFRTTIHWDGNLSFNTAGTAQLSFYTADSPGIYEIRLMGIAENSPFFGRYMITVD